MVNQPMESADTVAIATRSELGGRGRAFWGGFWQGSWFGCSRDSGSRGSSCGGLGRLLPILLLLAGSGRLWRIGKIVTWLYSGIRNQESGIRNQVFGNSVFGIRNRESGIRL